MGVTNSKAERSDALRLCKERKRFLKQTIDSRCALAAAHISYIQSLRNLGIAFRKYAEADAEILIEPSLSVSAIDPDKTSSHSTHPSPSPSLVGNVSSTLVVHESPISQPMDRVSYMRSGGDSALTVRVSPPPRNMYVEEGEFSVLPPPPPCPDSESSWDFFNPVDESENFRFGGQNLNLDHVRMYGDFGEKNVDFAETRGIPKLETPENEQGKLVVYNASTAAPENTENIELKLNVLSGNVVRNASLELYNLKRNRSFLEKDIRADTEDPLEIVTPRAKDFQSSLKEIDNQFFKASESGKEVSRMLESNKIRVGYTESRGKLPASVYLISFGVVCCQGRNVNASDVSEQNVTKVITWRRTTSSRSSSSKNPMATTKNDNDDSGSDFIEEFCMISGSHSSTLDRMYAWERKLYDEVKASEFIRKEYDRKCDKLRHQFAKDLSPQVIDKTRAVVRDLHSRIRVALHAVNSISKRIEKMRDEELLPQVLELIQGFTCMWKSMLECHHSQYMTISLAYILKSFSGAPCRETQKQIMNQLQGEVEYFRLSFTDWINRYTSYVEALNSWLQNCILQPRERYKGRRAFSPRRVLAPPIIVLCRDWSAGIKSLPAREVSNAIKAFLSDLQHSARHIDMHINEEAECKDDGKNNDTLNLSCIQTSLTKVLERLTKFSESSMKMCEDIHQKCEAARNAYDNYKAPPGSFSI
ncbi:Hypothetical predicted protein [Olea europaea subsp. europaea]|uniref:BZIP transcription factor n=1 Tax=Olea europaea subsp. europaea TaxID=158383 RepID=A0A8S0UDK2_OLEEU|nr:Hypothetical predicted protein [Olea europaea subsp. europaea]